jgi:hypothetical protein
LQYADVLLVRDDATQHLSHWGRKNRCYVISTLVLRSLVNTSEHQCDQTIVKIYVRLSSVQMRREWKLSIIICRCEKTDINAVNKQGWIFPPKEILELCSTSWQSFRVISPCVASICCIAMSQGNWYGGDMVSMHLKSSSCNILYGHMKHIWRVMVSMHHNQVVIFFMDIWNISGDSS